MAVVGLRSGSECVSWIVPKEFDGLSGAGQFSDDGLIHVTGKYTCLWVVESSLTVLGCVE